MTDDTTDDDTIYLVVAPYRGPQDVDFPTARVITADCGHQAWLSPQGESQLRDSTTICLPCAGPLMTPDRPMRAVKGAVEGIRENEGDEVAEVAQQFMRTLGIVEHDPNRPD